MSLLGSAAAFFLIAGFASSDDVVPGFAPPLYDRNHVIKGELVLTKLVTAVLATKVIAQKGVNARETNQLFFSCDRNVIQESKNRGNADRETHGSDFVFGLLDHFHLALKKQLDGALPAYDLEGFE